MSIHRGWRWTGFVALGLILYLAFLLVFAPAKYLTPLVEKFSGGTASLQEATGSLWSGSATLMAPGARTPTLGQIQWTLHPWKLFGGSLVADLQFSGNGVDARGTVDAGLQRHILRDVSAHGPVSMASLVYPAAEIFGLSGQLQITTTMVELNKEELRGTIELLWKDAGTRMVSISPLGAYRLRIAAERGKRAGLQLETIEGVLQISAQGEWRALEDGMLRLQGTITPSSAQPTLEPLLNLIGSTQAANGQREFKIEVHLPRIDTSHIF